MPAPLIRRELVERRGRFIWLTVAVTAAVSFTVGGFGLSAQLASVLIPATDAAAELALLPAGAVVITARTDALTTATALDERLLSAVRSEPGVAVAQGSFDQPLAFKIAADRQRDRPNALRGVVLSSTFDTTRWRVVAGRPPAGPNEVALDTAGLLVAGLDPSADLFSQARLFLPTGLRSMNVVGRVEAAGAETAAAESGASGIASAHAVLDPEVAARLLDAEGRVDRITVTPLPGVDPSGLERSLRSALPSGVRVTSALNRAAVAQHSVEQLDASIQRAVSGFAIVTVLIASMVVINTLSVLVAQRVREFALLRVIGAGRGHIVRAVIGQALVVGAVATVVGLGVGVVLGYAAARVVGTGSVDVRPVLTLAMTASAVVVGFGVTGVGALLPALRAGRVAPMAALSDTRAGADRPPRGLRSVSVLAFGSALVGLAFGVVGNLDLAPGPKWLFVGLGSVIAFVGLAGCSRWVVVPLLWVAHRGVSLVGEVASGLGVGNARRQPARTVGSASTLMVGLAMVGLVATLGASIRSSVLQQFRSSGRVDLYLERRGVVRVSPRALEGQLARELRGRGYFAALVSIDGSLAGPRVGFAEIDQPYAVEFGSLSGLTDLDVRVGRIGSQVGSEIGAGTAAVPPADPRMPSVAVSQSTADILDVTVGDRVTLRTVSGDETPYRVAGIYANTAVVGPAILDFSDQLDPSSIGTFEMGLLRFSGRYRAHAVDRAAARFPFLRVHTPAEFGALNASVVDTVLRVLAVVLVGMIGIGYLGVVATLGLSTLERRKELVMLRAIGAGRAQIRSMVRTEAAVIGLIAALIGVGTGIGLGVLVVRYGGLDVATEVVVPWLQLAAIAAVSVGLSLVVSLGVAHRASLLAPAEAGR